VWILRVSRNGKFDKINRAESTIIETEKKENSVELIAGLYNDKVQQKLSKYQIK
jgi:hypothetical protein